QTKSPTRGATRGSKTRGARVIVSYRVTRRTLDPPKCDADVVREVGGILDPARQADEPVRDSVGLPLGARDARVGHRRRVVDQGLHRAEALREREKFETFEEAEGRSLTSPKVEADDPPEAIHLAPGQGVLGVAGEARVMDPPDLPVTFEDLRHRFRALPVRPHPQPERTQPAEYEEAVERARNGTHRVLQPGESAEVLQAPKDEGAPDHVRVTTQILRGGVQDDVCVQFERALERRGGERVVDDDLRARGVRL